MADAITDLDRAYLDAAIAQAMKGLREGGIPIGASMAINDTLIAVGHNQREQLRDPILHAEMDCFRNAGRLTPDEYQRATVYSTLSPCAMCSGTILMFGVRRVVIADATTWQDPLQLLAKNGIEVLVEQRDDVAETLSSFIAANPFLWGEDVGGRD